MITGLLALALALPALVAPPADACPVHRVYDHPPKMRKIEGRYQVTLSYYRKYYSFKGGGYHRLQKVFLVTKSEALAKYIKAQGRTSIFWRVLKKAADNHTCADLYTGKRLVRLERAVAKAVAAHYKAKTRKRPARLDAMISGNFPGRQYCHPPKRPRPRP